jgi:preprotein translocase subunit SecD
MYELFRGTLLSLMICLSLACFSRNEAPAPCPAIELTEVADTPTDYSRPIALDDGTTILISRTPVVTTRDITGATTAQVESGWVVSYTLNEGAAKRLQEFTEQHVGRSLATVVDGKVTGTPRIAGPVVGGYRIGPMNRADAERLAMALSNNCVFR